jgi:L-rhamnonate dehydratase
VTGSVRAVRAYVLPKGGSDYHAREQGHWIAGRIATPMSRYPAYRENRTSWGMDVLGSLIVEVEDVDGAIGVGVTVGGVPAAWVVEHHLSRFVEGASLDDIEIIWDQMWRATMFYGRKGLVVNAISAVDLALWDLRGKAAGRRVCELAGVARPAPLSFYATGPDPRRAEELGFVGAKVPLRQAAWDGPDAIDAELRDLADLRDLVPDLPLRLDCWMALDLASATRLLDGLVELGFLWLEEPFPPEDYWSYAALRRHARGRIQIATGEHEVGVDGFRMLIEMGCADVIQPDVGWCGGMTELLRIDALARTAGIAVIPHGSSVYGYEFMHIRGADDPAEFLMMHPTAQEVIPMFSPLFLDEPVPVDGRLVRSGAAGFGVDLDPALPLTRPFARPAPRGRMADR